MKYLILIYSNPATRKLWEQFSDADQARGLQVYHELTKELAESGELLATESLDDPALTTNVRVEGGATLTSDGPFAEAKELLAGFYLVDCASRERATQIAARVPEAAFG
ncbi:MAG: YciI family protein, partial [Nonomuraea sp.]|nr:YciI family protein [Nonomuraea sp.]